MALPQQRKPVKPKEKAVKCTLCNGYGMHWIPQDSNVKPFPMSVTFFEKHRGATMECPECKANPRPNGDKPPSIKTVLKGII
jgi:DnaJ-class molecular chaperone